MKFRATPSLTVAFVALVTLSACGSAYISSRVDPSDSSVRVEPLTASSVSVANSSDYRPKDLPAVFYSSAGGTANLRGTGALPEPSQDTRPSRKQLETRVPPNVPQGPYQIGIGDVLLLATKSSSSTVEQLSGLLAAQNRRQGYTVQDDGAVAIPDVGRIQLAGMTLEEAEAELFQALVKNQIDPSFSLEVAEFNSKRVAIGGAVNRPGVAAIALTPLYLNEALNSAGGMTATNSEFTTIRIYRGGTLYQIPVERYLSQPDLQKVRLIDGDSIFVDTEFDLEQAQSYFQEQITLSEFRLNARNAALTQLSTEVSLRRSARDEARGNYQSQVDLDAVARDYVYLAGEVSKPGRFALPYGRHASLADALFSEGGFAGETGNPSQIYVLRSGIDPDSADTVVAWHLDARNAAQYVLATRMQMRPNDIIFIAEQPITRWNRVVKQMVPSLLNAGVNATN